MKNVFIVYGTTGEYSDRHVWAVCGYFDKEKAEKHAALAYAWLVNKEKELNPNEQKRERAGASLDYEQREALVNPYDDKMDIDYTGVDWYVKTVTILDEIPGV